MRARARARVCMLIYSPSEKVYLLCITKLEKNGLLMCVDLFLADN